jgi:hypothetical protein
VLPLRGLNTDTCLLFRACRMFRRVLERNRPA